MNLTLQVLTYKGVPIAQPLNAEFDEKGGTIGRKPGNTLVLVDPESFISGHHANISFQANCFYIQDASKNGTHLVNEGLTLNNELHLLPDNSLIRIGEYELIANYRVSEPITSPVTENTSGAFEFSMPGPFSADNSPFAAVQDDIAPFQKNAFAEELISSTFNDSFTPPPALSVGDAPKDIGDLLKGLDALAKSSDESELSPFQSAPDFCIDAPREIPEIKQFEVEAPKSSVAQPSPSFPEAPKPFTVAKSADEDAVYGTATDTKHLLSCFLEGAGVHEAAFSTPEQWPEVMRTAGILFRSLTVGLMDVLRARAEMKSEFRVSVTTIKSFDNNPLKFNPDVESVLKLMLMPGNPAFIDPKSAVDEAYNDISSHQMAMTAGIQASLVAILKRFDPDLFEKSLGEGIVFQKKAKCWDQYCEAYPHLTKSAQEDFFGEEFANAYEMQMKLLMRR
ncbi:type VI secretion system-associated FHA domain protein TagH [Methylomonas sp. MED-D]|uniref:type VI secretion system-associated FHA domain protein TagH n=1 Tax=unclassified Methylomonas TaxID=2608980 RepID=UPI0028A4DF51|nr:type VI secretion system-associated FHA domain protein TagH [Methylomonas sp. MV1]MDT4330355.1 type VI secretion system-associated FHA domain protein TagH [Methylomonas sp. MV1]